MIARTVGSAPPPPRRVAARAAAHRSPAMCKRKARMRGGGEGGRKCAFGGANFSKDGKAHNLCDAAKDAGCHRIRRAGILGRVGRLGRRRLLVGSRPTPLRGPALGEPLADPLDFRLPLRAAAAAARGGAVAIAAAALARPRRGAATPPHAVARWRKPRHRRRTRCNEALSLCGRIRAARRRRSARTGWCVSGGRFGRR